MDRIDEINRIIGGEISNTKVSYSINPVENSVLSVGGLFMNTKIKIGGEARVKIYHTTKNANVDHLKVSDLGIAASFICCIECDSFTMFIWDEEYQLIDNSPESEKPTPVTAEMLGAVQRVLDYIHKVYLETKNTKKEKINVSQFAKLVDGIRIRNKEDLDAVFNFLEILESKKTIMDLKRYMMDKERPNSDEMDQIVLHLQVSKVLKS